MTYADSHYTDSGRLNGLPSTNEFWKLFSDDLVPFWRRILNGEDSETNWWLR